MTTFFLPARSLKTGYFIRCPAQGSSGTHSQGGCWHCLNTPPTSAIFHSTTCSRVQESFLHLPSPSLHASDSSPSLQLLHSRLILSLSDAGSSPSGKFTALIRAVSPVVSLSQPILKLIQMVSRSPFCAQVKEGSSLGQKAVPGKIPLPSHKRLLSALSSTMSHQRERDPFPICFWDVVKASHPAGSSEFQEDGTWAGRGLGIVHLLYM